MIYKVLTLHSTWYIANSQQIVAIKTTITIKSIMQSHGILEGEFRVYSVHLSYFIDSETEDQRTEIICLRWLTWLIPKNGKLGTLTPSTMFFHYTIE